MSKFRNFYFPAIGITALVAMLITTFGVSVVTAESVLSDAELEDDVVESETLSSVDTIEFTLDARWGYVYGNPDGNHTEKIYDGEVYTNNKTIAKIRLQKTLLFEDHDSVKSKDNPVSWNSKIYGHWDGALVYVKAKANANITVTVDRLSMTITKTAKEWYELSHPAVAFTGCGTDKGCSSSHEMLVVKTQPKKHRKHAVIFWWGKAKNVSESDIGICEDHTYSNCPAQCERICLPSVCGEGEECTADCEGVGSCYSDGAPKVNFSGSLKMDTDINIKLKKSLRFESNDKIDDHNRKQIDWTSYITTGRDGLFTLMLPTQNSSLNSGFSIHFYDLYDDSDQSWWQSYTLEEVKAGIRETITVNDIDYVLIIGYKTIPKKLVRTKHAKKLYLIEDNIVHAATDSDILEANGYDEDEAVEMDDDELESYEEGDELDYPEGTVVEAGNKSYIISNGVKRLLKNDRVKSGITWLKQLKKMLSLEKLQNITEGPEVDSEEELSDNSLVTIEGDTAVWRIRGGKRQVFNHAKIFDLHKLNWGQIKKISVQKLQEYDWAAPVKYPDGSLVKIPTDPKVYLLINGIRRWVETEADLKGLGYKFSDIVDMSPTEIINYDEGDPVIAGEETDVTEF